MFTICFEGIAWCSITPLMSYTTMNQLILHRWCRNTIVSMVHCRKGWCLSAEDHALTCRGQYISLYNASSGTYWLGMCSGFSRKPFSAWCCHLWTNFLTRWLRLSQPALWSLLNNSALDGHGLSVCLNPDCRCRLLPKSRHLPFSGFLPLDVSSPAVGDIFRSGRCRCVLCSGSQRTVSSSA